jgi:anti-sigma B factor antagonist
MDLSVNVVPHNSWIVVVALGEVDLSTAPILRTTLRQCIGRLTDGDTGIAVDLDGVGFCDSVGLGVLVGARRRTIEAGHHFSVIVSSDRLLTTLSRAGLDGFFDVVGARHDLT